MNKLITDVITSYKPGTINSLKDQQLLSTPYVDTNIFEKQVFEYTYDSQRFIVDVNYEVCFRLHYMYLKSMDPRKYIQYSICKDSIKNLVSKNVIDPFLLFIDKKMVPWSMISIIITHEEYYILCKTYDPSWIYKFKKVNSIDIMHLPNGCVYKDTHIGDNDNRIFGFTTNGYFSDDPDCPISIINESPFMRFDSYITNGPVNAYSVSEDTSIKFFPSSVILFRNRLLDTDSKIHFESTLLSISDGVNPKKDTLNFDVFSDIRTKGTLDNIKHANLSYIGQYVEKQNAGQEVPTWIVDLEKQFDFEMSRMKDYNTNVEESLDYIIKYNASLLEDIYLANRNLTVEEKDGQWVLNNVRDDGTLRIPRKHGLFTDEYILMLVNGILYKFYYAAKYTPDHYIIPIKDITAEDTVDFLRFSDVNNNSFDITVSENEEFRNYDENYINDNMVLFSTIPPENHYTFPEDGLQHFPINYTIEYDSSKRKRIRFEDPKYYGTNIKIAYKHQFRHFWYNIDEVPEHDTFKLDLGTKFMYCHDYSKYLVFYNGRRLSTDQYRLCLPVRPGTPYSRFELYLTMLINQGDRIDVIYTPSLLKDVILTPEIADDGKITVDKSEITYSLNKNLYMVWANGKKIPSSKISNVDSTHIKISEDIKTVKYVCITKFLPDIDELVDIFQSSTALWDHIISQLTDDEILHLLNMPNVEITNTEQDIYSNSVGIRSIMLELIREKYMLGANVDTSEPFVYDYTDVDTTAIESYDKDGNALLMSGDSNRTDNIDVPREWK